MPAARPLKPPPFWLRFVVPGADGLASNPLYLRLSGRAYSRPSKFLRSRKLEEFSRPPTTFVTGVGLPFTVWIGSMVLNMFVAPLAAGPTAGKTTTPSPILFIVMLGLGFSTTVGFLWTMARIVSLGRTVGVPLFIQNAGRLQWGESLYLSLLRPEEIDDAVIGALVEREARGLAIGLGILAIGPAALFFFLAALNGQNVPLWALVYSVWAAPIALAVYGYLFALQIYNLANQVEGAVDAVRGAWGQTFLKGCWGALVFCLIHLPGGVIATLYIGFCVGAWAARPRFAPEAVEIWIAWQVGIAAFIVPTALIMLSASRWMLERVRGRIGEAMAESVRRGQAA